MFSPCICGSLHHHQENEEDDLIEFSPSSTPRTSRKNSFCRKRDKNNPYSHRGLDKFSALLADLDDKRRKIYIQKGSEDISFVRFVYSDSNDFKPVVVKVKNRKQTKIHKPINEHPNAALKVDQHEELQPPRMEAAGKTTTTTTTTTTKKKKNIFSWVNIMRRPSYYFPVIIILIMVFLALFGRSFAILCTSLGWYLVPTINGGDSNSKRMKKNKKGHKNERKIAHHDSISSPTSVITGMNDVSPRRHDHRRNW